MSNGVLIRKKITITIHQSKVLVRKWRTNKTGVNDVAMPIITNPLAR